MVRRYYTQLASASGLKGVDELQADCTHTRTTLPPHHAARTRVCVPAGKRRCLDKKTSEEERRRESDAAADTPGGSPAVSKSMAIYRG